LEFNMNVYWITGLPTWLRDGGSAFAATLNDVQEITDQVKHPEQRAEVLVTLREVETDKAAIVRMLNNAGGYMTHPLRSWEIGPRGGLREIPPEDSTP
jgi:hypothetical protein